MGYIVDVNIQSGRREILTVPSSPRSCPVFYAIGYPLGGPRVHINSSRHSRTRYISHEALFFQECLTHLRFEVLPWTLLVPLPMVTILVAQSLLKKNVLSRPRDISENLRCYRGQFSRPYAPPRQHQMGHTGMITPGRWRSTMR